jgi:hypothetical protein
MLRLLLSSALVLSACTPSTQCPPTQGVCGTGCIPKDAVCCNDGAGTSSYCANHAAGACSPNPAGTCAAATVGQGQAAFCCDASTNTGSNDCAAGQHHCGLTCRAESESCCARSTDLCSASAGAGGGAGGAGGGGGSATCSLIGTACTTSSLCCDGLTTGTSTGTCSCVYLEGQPCYADGNVSFYRGTECCATNGPTKAMGTVKASCKAGAAQCSSDAQCRAGSRCDPTWDCLSTCSGVGVNPNAKYPCCDGLVLGTTGHNAGFCAVASGKTCFIDGDCASNHCVAGASTATCQ